MRIVPGAIAALAFFTAACSKPADQAATDTSAAAPAAASEASVSITSPAEGDSVSLPFTVTLQATGVEVVPANGTNEPGKGHHHLIIDGDFNGDTLPLAPAPIVIHMGNGATERVMDSLTKGPHRIISIFADGMHVPIKSVRADTLNVIVR
jgi:hypothetical protein